MTEITIQLDDARKVMYDELVDEFCRDEVNETLEKALAQHVTKMYDEREQLSKRVEQLVGDG